MRNKTVHTILNFSIAAIWIANGLFCKILNLVPRHEQIVSRILGADYSRLFTLTIGISEVMMAVWILSKVKSRMNAIVQIIVIACMNALEFILVPDLLLWGKFNSLYALLLIFVIYINEFYINPRIVRQT